MIRVLGPFGPGGLPVKTLDGTAQAVDERDQPGAGNPGAAGALRAGVGGRVLALRPGMQVHVGQETEVEPGSSRQELRREVQRDAVGIGPLQRPEADVTKGHQRERRQEVLAELAVGDPRAAVLERLERERIDEDRPAIDELHVVGGCVPQGAARPRAASWASSVRSAASRSSPKVHSCG